MESVTTDLQSTVSKLFRREGHYTKPLWDVGWCSKEVLLPQKVLWTCGMCCSVARQ